MVLDTQKIAVKDVQCHFIIGMFRTTEGTRLHEKVTHGVHRTKTYVENTNG